MTSTTSRLSSAASKSTTFKSAQPLAPSRPNRVWIQSARWDLLWIFSGVWAPLFVGTLARVSLLSQAVWLGAVYLVLGVVHRVTTTYGVLFSPLFAEARKTD